MTPTICTACPFWVNGCSIEPLYAVGYLKACPNLSGPVLNEYGHIMNPPWDEKYILPDGHVFLHPEKIENGWKIRYTIFKKGAGTCGSVNDIMYIIAYKKAIAAVCEDTRIDITDRVVLQNPFINTREFSLRDGEVIPEVVIEPVPEVVSEPEIIPEPEPEVVPYVSPFENIDTSTAGDQMELF